jgi:hypothetical protein
MIVILTVMSDMDLSHDYWGLVGLGLVECWVWTVLGYRGETCELCLVLASGVSTYEFCLVWLQGKTCKPVALVIVG